MYVCMSVNFSIISDLEALIFPYPLVNAMYISACLIMLYISAFVPYFPSSLILRL